MEELCQCGHDKEEHAGHIGYCGCDGFVTDGNSAGSIGCYCHGFIPRTESWEEEQKQRAIREFDRKCLESSFWYKIRKILGV